jgi:hypothetical protein
MCKAETTKLSRRQFGKSFVCGSAALLLSGWAPLSAVAAASEEHVALAIRGAGTIPAGIAPNLGCWFWNAVDREPENYKPFLNTVALHSPYTLLTTSMRIASRRFTDKDVHDAAKAAAVYARQRGIGVVLELPFTDSFTRDFPGEILEQVVLKTVPLADSGQVTVGISYPPGDSELQGWSLKIGPARLLHVYCFGRDAGGMKPETIRDITSSCKVAEVGATGTKIEIPCSLGTKGLQACAMFSIPYEWPDIFSPHVMAFHRKMIQSYADVGLAGVCLDEWGIPVGDAAALAPDRLWYSKHWAAVYAKRTGGRDLLRDLLLMCQGESGHESQRLAAINHYMEMIWQGNAAIEENFYKATKATFGPAAFVGTHPTWWPYPDAREVARNGLDWWEVRRDWAQVDEVTPFCVRTALAKKWGSPIWYNMFYAKEVADYERSLWTHVLGGGRINYHPQYPVANGRGWNYNVLLTGELMHGECRVRLLDFISGAPLDCPVAVIFGHAAAINWIAPGFGDPGVSLCDALWKEGYYADLIPSSEISSGALKIAADGHIQYGRQRYSAAVLYEPQYGRLEVAEFFRKAAEADKTALDRVGEWTKDFYGKPFSGGSALPAQMASAHDAASATAAIVERLRRLGVAPQEPATGIIGWDKKTAAPPAKGRCHLIDGTEILVAGERSVAGDPIQTTLGINGRKVAFDAKGIAAVRLSKDGKLEAMAAGGLKSFVVAGLEIELTQRADVALWRDAHGEWQGVLQDHDGHVPDVLLAITKNWLRLSVPARLE